MAGDQPELFAESTTAPSPVPTAPPLIVATDGSCLRNPGPGGWCWFVNDQCWAAGGEDPTTNNRMELLAVLMLLDTLPDDRPVHILADSSYVIDALTKWRHGWKRRGWKTASGDPVKNLDLIEHLDALVSVRMPTFEWVRGHTGHPANEAADVRARAVAEAIDAGVPFVVGPGLVG